MQNQHCKHQQSHRHQLKVHQYVCYCEPSSIIKHFLTGTKPEAYSQAPSTADLMTLVAKKIPTKWYEVGVLLDVETPTLDSLEAQTTDQVRLFMKVFNQWKQEGKVPYTWDTIISTLEKADDNNTATNIRKWLDKEQH